MLTQLLTQQCQIVRRTDSGQADAYGDDVAGETVAAAACELQQELRTEPFAEVGESRWRLFVEAGTDIDTNDAVVVGDYVYELVGQPWSVHNPRTEGVSHVEATVVRVGGAEGS